jgi:hypothetical protein
MNSRVRGYITDQVTSGRISPLQALQIGQSLSSVQSQFGGISSLPDSLREVVTAAFRDGLRWAFISLLPWLVIAFALCVFLKKVPDERLNQLPGQTPKARDEEMKMRKEAEKKEAEV